MNNLKGETMKKQLLLSLALLGILSLTSCTAEKYGPGGLTGHVKQVKVKDILMNADLAGQAVSVEGSIATQCTSNGCWFFVDDGTGKLFVDLSTNNFSLPPRIGKKAKVTGIANNSQDGMLLVASEVEVR